MKNYVKCTLNQSIKDCLLFSSTKEKVQSKRLSKISMSVAHKEMALNTLILACFLSLLSKMPSDRDEIGSASPGKGKEGAGYLRK